MTNTSADPQNYALLATDPATELQYTATGGPIAAGATIAVVLNHNEPDIAWDFYGTINMALEGTSSTLNLAPRIDVKSIPTTHPDWTFNTVTYGTQTWMDRNLGARRPAEAIDDILSYGNHYQWGRPADGHEITVWNGDDQTSSRGFYDAITTLATTDTPGHPNFILNDVTPFDWRSDNNNNRWATANQGPCPADYHVPSETEWNTADTASLGSGNGTNGGNTLGWDNNVETYESALQLPSAGFRSRITGSLVNQGTTGYYWSTTVDLVTVPRSTNLEFSSTSAIVGSVYRRALGFSVRCLKD